MCIEYISRTAGVLLQNALLTSCAIKAMRLLKLYEYTSELDKWQRLQDINSSGE